VEGASVVVTAAAVVTASRGNPAADEPALSGPSGDRYWEQSLSAPQLRGILRALERIEMASSLASFREAVIDGIEGCLGYPHSAFLVGPEADAELDAAGAGAGGGSASPVPACARGLAVGLYGPLTKRFAGLLAGPPGPDASTGPSLSRAGGDSLGRSGPVRCLVDATRPDELGRVVDIVNPPERRRFERLLNCHGARDSLLIDLAGPSTIPAMVVVVDSVPGAFDVNDRAVLGVLGRHTAALFRHHGQRRRAPSTMRALTGRARTVVSGVADGHTNREIAEGLGITVDTVKHIVRRSMATTGCANRTQLALAWQRENARIPAPAAVTDRRRAG
jgi:DNA-binding CsgD family transcriptional regulator